MRAVLGVVAAACCVLSASGAAGQERPGYSLGSSVADFIDRFWCRVPDPAAKACKGTISARALRRCIPSRIPPSTELQKSIRPIVHAFENCKARIDKEGEEAVMPYLESTLSVIKAEHGRKSPAYANTLTQIVVLLANNGDRFDLVRPYSERAVAVTREVYGKDHRETAIVLQTHADILIKLNETEHIDEVISLLREAADIRRRVIGSDHAETLAAEMALTNELLQKRLQTDDLHARDELLKEAEELAAHAAATMLKSPQSTEMDRLQAEAVLGRIAYARGDHEKAVIHFKAAFDLKDPFLKIFACGIVKDACREYALALRKLGRKKEAETVEEDLERVQ